MHMDARLQPQDTEARMAGMMVFVVAVVSHLFLSLIS